MPRPCLPILLLLAACAGHQPPPSTDAAFAGVQARGAVVMGVSQATSRHVFEDLPDGGRILYVMVDAGDTAGAAMIRQHLAHIAERFAAGDFSDPARVHAMAVPGTEVMAARRERIRYAMQERPGGGEVRITTTDPEALVAVREFLAFQRSDHRAPGSESAPAMDPDHARHHPGTR
ncbi:MAG: hypothetical protein KA180_01620 [Gemmatimonadales bacterium]|nr:hypothetical protein [Gemmatimonadota bacterium]MBK7783029.1 hypothetical protein [Gemmatimonadota bacterium]MBK9068921.1 hypothetical protein [Gemmatimonadota bacterium]MBP6668116.1 hypothetical protein [Gemmatimonadales bacterium]MBP9202156.1 hypothetical protein [Gemmatimonadales bacterium]